MTPQHARHRVPVVDYDDAVADLRRQLAALPADAPVRLGKKTSNLFRPRAAATHRLDVSAFSGVLSVEDGFAEVLGMTTYEDLVDATLPSGQMPLVVPQLKTITLGGAVTGLGIESSSFRNGVPHESVVEMDVLTGAGEVVTCSRELNSDLFFGFANSYGTLGYALRLRIELEPTHPYVHLTHVRCGSVAEAVEVVRLDVEVHPALRAVVDALDLLEEQSGVAVGLRVQPHVLAGLASHGRPEQRAPEGRERVLVPAVDRDALQPHDPDPLTR